MAFFQYLKDTRGELNHVAWPTRVQTIIFTVLVIVISILTSLYLGLFDYIFTNGLGEIVERFPGSSAPPAAEIVDVETEPIPSDVPIQVDSITPVNTQEKE